MSVSSSNASLSGNVRKRRGDDNSLSLLEQTSLHCDDEEAQYMERVCDSLRQYSTFSRSARMGMQRRVYNLPEHQKSVLPKSMIYGTIENKEREKVLRNAEIRNQFFIDSILIHAGVPNSQQKPLPKRDNPSNNSRWASDDDISKVSSILKSVSRDWSDDGASERARCIDPILTALKRHLPMRKSNSQTFDSNNMPITHHRPRVLVPGAGLGRLALEICSLGYEVQGNEISLHMLLASDFILNGGLSPSRQFSISPWFTESRNVSKCYDPARKIQTPDVDPVAMLTNGESRQPDFSMVAGDFVDVYSNTNQYRKWDCVACCFFLDTASSIVEYLQVIYDILDDDGLLVNIGPLLYHWSGPTYRPNEKDESSFLAKHDHMDEKYMKSVDMCWDDVRTCMINIGFVFLEENEYVPCKYTSDKTSLMSTIYDCIFFVAKKERRGR